MRSPVGSSSRQYSGDIDDLILTCLYVYLQLRALSRSAQYWSSYSGYLREVAQLCYAFGRWNDIDMAKEIYRNTTEHTMLMLKNMKQSEEKGLVVRDEIASVAEVGIFSHIANHAADELQTLHHLLKDIKSAHSGLDHASAMLQSEVANIHLSVSSTVEYILGIHRRDEEERMRHTQSQASVAIKDMLQQHVTSLDTLATSFGGTLEIQLFEVISRIEPMYETIGTLSEHILSKWQSFDRDLDHMHLAVAEATGSVRNAAVQLQTYVDEAALAQQTQQDATQSAIKLAELLTRMANNTKTEMSKINETAIAMREDLLSMTSFAGPYSLWLGRSSWLQQTAAWLVDLGLRAEPAYLDPLIRMPVRWIIVKSTHIAIAVIRVICSSFTGVLVLAISSQRTRTKPASIQSAHVSETPSDAN
ncbi:hypothetical protein NM688_g511 [Phlebia brevispora]|uniref:Uncharacterized protein n=1 Tax=Phlebia brevispora TaxID=194682 RepID=A0ACC1TEB0_9APHY|nr:hypothetical protein NM688_g511 [Phlebia brevispora]